MEFCRRISGRNLVTIRNKSSRKVCLSPPRSTQVVQFHHKNTSDDQKTRNVAAFKNKTLSPSHINSYNLAELRYIPLLTTKPLIFSKIIHSKS